MDTIKKLASTLLMHGWLLSVTCRVTICFTCTSLLVKLTNMSLYCLYMLLGIPNASATWEYKIFVELPGSTSICLMRKLCIITEITIESSCFLFIFPKSSFLKHMGLSVPSFFYFMHSLWPVSVFSWHYLLYPHL